MTFFSAARVGLLRMRTPAAACRRFYPQESLRCGTPSAWSAPFLHRLSVASETLPWKKPAEGPTFPNSDKHPTEFRTSGVPGAGNGWWAKAFIPAGVRLRYLSVADGTLHRFADEKELRASGWDIDDAVNYGIAHKSDKDAIFYLDPGTACNHADKTRVASVKYNMEKKGVMEIWTIRDVNAGEEMFINYADNFVACPWFDRLCAERGLTPLSKLPEALEKGLA